MNLTNFVNESRNIVWISGYARGGDGNTILMYQSASEDRAIPVHVDAKMRRPRPNTPCEIKCHAMGYRDADGKQWVRLEAIQIKRASVSNVPRRLVIQNAMRPNAAVQREGWSPFDSIDKIRSEIRESLRLEDQVVNDLLNDSAGNGPRGGGFVNKVILSGFVGHKAYMPPSDDGSGDLGHVLLHLRQHPDAQRALPIRIQGADSRFGKLLKSLHPLNIIGEVRVAVTKDSDGNIVMRHAYLAAEKNSVGQGSNTDFGRGSFPLWWADAVRDHYAQKRALLAEQQAASTQPAPTQPSPQLPAGVQVASDVF